MGNSAFKDPKDIDPAQRNGVLGGSPSLRKVADLIASGCVKNIVVVCGAGISVSTGIPDFRTPGSGLYDNLKKYNLPDGKPESVFDLEYFRLYPEAFFTLAKELFPGNFKPSVCHFFFRLLYEKGVLRRIYTQNIDSLERIAGIPDNIVVPCHGNFDAAHCIECGVNTNIEWLRAEIFAGRHPRCGVESCG